MTKSLAKRAPEEWRKFLQAPELAEKIKGVLPRHLNPERMALLVLGEMARNPKIAECTSASVALCYLTCSQLGLEPSSPLGHVYLIPRKLKGVMTLTVLVGYKGMLELARRTRDVTWIGAKAVYEDEITRGLWRGSIVPPQIEHKWGSDIDRSDNKIVAAYCMITMKGGGQYQEILTRDEIDARRKRSRASNDGPWVTDFAAMCRKTPIRALLTGGTVPLSAEVAEGLRHEADELAPDHRVIDVAADPVAALDEMVAERAELPPRLPECEVIDVSFDAASEEPEA